MFFDYERTKLSSLDDYELTTDSKISIPPHIWREITTTFSKKDIIEHLSNLIEVGKLPFPLREYSSAGLDLDFKMLKNEDCLVKLGDWECLRTIPNQELSYRGRRCYFNPSSNGLSVSDNFTQLERMECSHFEHKSPMREWTREGCRSKTRYMLRVLWTLNEKDALENGVSNKQLRDCIRLGNYQASQFKPSCAKTIYDFFGAKKVLDFSAGWGDRLVGFLASSAESYVGIDPNSKLTDKYRAISSFCSTDKQTSFICSPAEDADLSNMRFDFVFTSPPYFNIERYSEESTQSWKRYKTESDWLEFFLLVALKKSWDSLEDGGRIAINIADKGHSRTDVISSICTPMLSYMESLGAVFEGVIGYRMNKRPGDRMGSVGGSVFGEPIFVWSKGVATEPKWKQDNFFGI